MARKVKTFPPEIKKKKESIFSRKFLEELAYEAQREVLPQLEKLISIQEDARIISKQPAHYYRYLYFLAHAIKPKLSVELGTWHGLSAASLADGSPEGKVVTIDKDEVIHKDARRLNVDYWHQASTIKLKYELNNIDILFIDAGHDGQCVDEYHFWFPRMNNKSIILFDDINLNDVMKSFWRDFNPVTGQKIDLPIHEKAGFGLVLIDN